MFSPIFAFSLLDLKPNVGSLFNRLSLHMLIDIFRGGPFFLQFTNCFISVPMRPDCIFLRSLSFCVSTILFNPFEFNLTRSFFILCLKYLMKSVVPSGRKLALHILSLTPLLYNLCASSFWDLSDVDKNM